VRSRKLVRRSVRRCVPAVRRLANPSVTAARAEARERMQGAGALMIGGVRDPAEKAAERVSDRVMRMPAPTALVRRKCAECAADERAQPQEAGEAQGTVRLHAAATAIAPGATPARAPAAAQAALGAMGAGRPLSRSERAFFEPRFGVDFSRVRVHDDVAAGRAAGVLDARALTLGQDIAFAPGERAPGTPHADRLLAHELAHVTQRRAGEASVPASGFRALIRRIPKDPSGVPFDGEIIPWEAALRRTPQIPADDPHSNVIADLPRGHRVRILGGGAWLFVRTHVEGKDLVGYVSHELIKEVGGAATTFTTDVGNPVSTGGATPVPSLEEEREWMENHGLASKVRRIRNTATDSYNCHGFVYLDAAAWLNDPSPVIKDNNYFVPAKPDVDDAVVYTKSAPTLDKDNRPSFSEIPPHSGLVTKGGPGNPTQVTSKWGSWHVYQHRPADVWAEYGKPTFLRSTRGGGHTAKREETP
jgi:hypothetical protein